MMTQCAVLKTPISFFSPLKLMPVFPPTDASTIANKVVGILMNAMPRLNVEAANPPKSVTMPPPKLISNDFRLAPCSSKAFHTCCRESKFLWMSPAGMVIMPASFK